MSRLDQRVFAEVVAAFPPLASTVRELGRPFVENVFMVFWQVDPQPYGPFAQLFEESTLLRQLTVLDRYGSAVATLYTAAHLHMDVTDPHDRLADAAADEAYKRLTEERRMWEMYGVEESELRRVSFLEREALAKTLSRSKLGGFLDLVGRFRRMEASLRSRRVQYQRDTLVDVEISDRIADMIASEHANRAHRATRLDLLRRMSEGQVLTYQFAEPAHKQCGPVVVLLDESESMDAIDMHRVTREAWAKALTLALVQRARSQGRDVVLISFSSAGQQVVRTLPNARWTVHDLVDFATHFFAGQTEYETPLDLAIDAIADRNGMADLVLITDDEQSVSARWLESYRQAKARLGFRAFGVAIGTGSGQSLKVLCDDVRSVADFTAVDSVHRVFQLI